MKSFASCNSIRGRAVAGVFLALVLACASARAQSGVALAFDGVDDSVSLPEIIFTGSSYTKEAWVYYTGGAQDRNIISSENNRFWLQAGVLKVMHNGANVVSDTAALPANTWVHVAVTYDADAPLMKLYRNGRLVAQSSSAQPYTGGTMGLGAYLTDANPEGAEFWRGRLDEVRVWGAARSQGQILARMNTELTSTETDLLACYQFSEGEPGGENQGQTEIVDFTGANSGIPNNFALSGPDSNYVGPGFTPPAPPTGRALAFNGINNFVLTPFDADSDVLPDTTWEAWIYPTADDATTRVIFSVEDGGFDRAVVVYGNDFRVFTKTPNYWVPAQISLNQWQHIAVVYSGTEVRFYKNGVEFTGPATAQTSGTTAQTLALGAHPAGNSFFAGRMDEVRIWNYARDQTDIADAYATELVGDEPNLAAYFNFNQGDAGLNNAGLLALVDSVADSTSHGTLNGFTLTGTNSNWVAPGFAPTPDIEMRGNGLAIARGDTTPATADGTQFGLVAVASGAATRAFTITNTGSGPLTVSTVTVTGTGAADFAVSGISLPTNIVAGGGVRLTVRFDPSAEGARNATITVASDDPDEASYGFAVQGTGGTPAAFVTGDVFTSSSTGVFNVGSGGDFAGAAPFASPGFSFGQFAWSASLRTMYLTIYTAGKVVAIKPDGTVTDFATGLSAPTGLLRTTDGRLLVGEQTTGQVTDITAGGDFTGAPAFASGLGGVGSLVQAANGKIYAAEHSSGEVSEITAGGVIGTNAVLAGGLPGSLTDLAHHPVSGRLLVVTYFGSAVYEITGPGAIAEFASGQNFTGITVDAAGRVLAQCAASADIFDTPAGGDFSEAVPFADGFTGLDQALDTVPAAAAAPIIAVRGNGNSIPDGSTTPSVTNLTDFGNVALGSPLLRTFTIANTGGAALTLGGIGITGADTADFTLGGIAFPMTIAASNSTIFTLTFNPGASGARTATLIVTNSDSETPRYSFAVAGAGFVPPGAALAFDGVNDNVSLGNPPALGFDHTNAFTLEFWFRTGSGDLQALVSKLEGSAPFRGYEVYLDGGNLHVLLNNTYLANMMLVSTLNPFHDGQWHHAAISYNGSASASGLKIYMDGAMQSLQVSTDNLSADITTTGPVYLGIRGNGTLPFGGALDEVRFWSRALCADEILARKDCEPLGAEPGLVAYFKFNQGDAGAGNPGVGTLTNFVAGGVDGTLFNFALSGTNSNWITPGSPASGTNCALFLPVEIDLLGNGASIPSGSATPVSTNGTDFGSLGVGQPRVRTFTITNAGLAPLTVTGIGKSGTNTADFAVSGLGLPANVGTNSAVTFTVTFTPSATGSRSATLTITNTDCDEGNYTFAVQGTGTNPPPFSLTVQRSGTNAVLLWPVSGLSDTLEKVTNRASGQFQWGPAGVTPASDGTNYQITVPLAPNTNSFFRVRRQ
ncbi:MAG: choice-of-anchor D domain-containing protein [Verrucomicrobia bacterium]|nr:choice-of-anchor D domain-containing protein [Verrucomicrobiota bacterium]